MTPPLQGPLQDYFDFLIFFVTTWEEVSVFLPLHRMLAHAIPFLTCKLILSYKSYPVFIDFSLLSFLL